jgi:hypothetical protein
VFFGRDPWLILCTNGSSIDTVFEGTSRAEKSVKFGSLDCSSQLPSKKTVFERLALNQEVSQPILFFTGIALTNVSL